MASQSFVRSATEAEEAALHFDALFRGVSLPLDMEARARAIISQCVANRHALPSQMKERSPSPMNDGGTVIPGIWSRTFALHAARDAALRALLTDPEQQRLFDTNAAAMQGELASVRPSGAT